MGHRIYHIAALILLLFGACSKAKEDCTEKGAYATIERSLDGFHAISVADRLDVKLVHDPARLGTIELSCFSNLFSGVHSEVKEGMLYLSDHNRCKWLRELDTRITITVYVDENLDFLYTLDDASFTTSDTLQFDFLQMDHRSTKNQFLRLNGTRFWIEHYEAGEVILEGITPVIKVTSFESGVFDGRNLHSDDVFVFHYGLNKIHVNASRILECRIENTGDILYYQEPSNSLLIKGDGKGKLLRAF